MREILFRGKDKYSERWYEGFILNKNQDKIGYYNNCMSFNIIEINPETIGQYTGLTDKNDKKIFEGDIVKAKIVYSGLVNVFTKEEIVVVKYIEGCFYPLYDYVKKEIEVIGNIHDNPELLEVKE